MALSKREMAKIENSKMFTALAIWDMQMQLQKRKGK